MHNEIPNTLRCAEALKESLSDLILQIGSVPVGVPGQFPFGWRKAAKGRTVWRLLEEVISQNLETRAAEIGLSQFSPAQSEVGVYDFSFQLANSIPKTYVNIKSSVRGGRQNKDDISKARPLLSFIANTKDCILLIASIEIDFLEQPMRIDLTNCYVVPVTWLPDIYVNPSNNGNLQSSKYKNIEESVRRTRSQFTRLLRQEIELADLKRASRGGP